MQSRGKPPVANCIFAKFLHARRSLLRRFANMSIPGPVRSASPDGAAALPKNRWNWPIATARNVAIAFEVRLPNRAQSAIRRPKRRQMKLTAQPPASQFSAN
jgi:hypothetical protein